MIIKTERLLIRKFSKEDIDLIFDINNHQECIKFNGWESMTIGECEDVLDRWMLGYKNEDAYGAFCVEEIQTGEPVGMTFIMKLNGTDQYEIGFRLKRNKWGLGYAKEISKGYIDYGRDILKAEKLVAEVYRNNERSRNVFEKIGFETLEHPNGPTGVLYVLYL